MAHISYSIYNSVSHVQQHSNLKLSRKSRGERLSLQLGGPWTYPADGPHEIGPIERPIEPSRALHQTNWLDRSSWLGLAAMDECGVTPVSVSRWSQLAIAQPSQTNIQERTQNVSQNEFLGSRTTSITCDPRTNSSTLQIRWGINSWMDPPIPAEPMIQSLQLERWIMKVNVITMGKQRWFSLCFDGYQVGAMLETGAHFSLLDWTININMQMIGSIDVCRPLSDRLVRAPLPLLLLLFSFFLLLFRHQQVIGANESMSSTNRQWQIGPRTSDPIASQTH